MKKDEKIEFNHLLKTIFITPFKTVKTIVIAFSFSLVILLSFYSIFLSLRLNNVQKKYSELEQKYNSLQVKYDALKDDYNNLKNEFDALNESYFNKQKEIQLYKDEIIKLRTQKNNIEKKFKDIRKILTK